MNPPALGRLDRLAGAVDVLLARTRKSANDRVLDPLGDLLHGVEVAFGGDRESGLDDVDPHRIEQLGDLELLLVCHRGAGRLLTIAQGSVKNDDAILLGLCGRGHGKGSFSWFAPSLPALLPVCRRGKEAGARGFRGSGRPLSAQAQCPAGPQGLIRSRSPPRTRAAPARASSAPQEIARKSRLIDILALVMGRKVRGSS